MVKTPRTSIGGLMAVTALLAVDLAAFASSQQRRSRAWDREFMIGVVPVVNVLALGLFLLARQLIRRGESHGFLVGFEASGWLAVGGLMVATLVDDDAIWRYQWYVNERLTDLWFRYVMWTGEFTRKHVDELRTSFRAIALVVPLLGVAALGGWVSRSLGVVLVRGGTTYDRRRAIPLRKALIAAAVAAVVFFIPGLWAVEFRGRQMLYRQWARHVAFIERSQRVNYESAHAQEQSFRERLRSEGLSPSEVSVLQQNAESARAEAERALREWKRYEGWEAIYRRAARYPWREAPPPPRAL